MYRRGGRGGRSSFGFLACVLFLFVLVLGYMNYLMWSGYVFGENNNNFKKKPGGDQQRLEATRDSTTTRTSKIDTEQHDVGHQKQHAVEAKDYLGGLNTPQPEVKYPPTLPPKLVPVPRATQEDIDGPPVDAERNPTDPPEPETDPPDLEEEIKKEQRIADERDGLKHQGTDPPEDGDDNNNNINDRDNDDENKKDEDNNNPADSPDPTGADDGSPIDEEKRRREEGEPTSMGVNDGATQGPRPEAEGNQEDEDGDPRREDIMERQTPEPAAPSTPAPTPAPTTTRSPPKTSLPTINFHPKGDNGVDDDDEAHHHKERHHPGAVEDGGENHHGIVHVETKKPRPFGATPPPPVVNEYGEEEAIDPNGEDEEEDSGPVNHVAYEKALNIYNGHLKENHTKRDNGVTNDFTSVDELADHGVLLPHDKTRPPDHRWLYCDPSDTLFSDEKDKHCQGYLSDLNNMRSIKVLSSHLYNGRTIKFKIYYWHNGISVIVKVSQNKFVFEAASEYIAFTMDRILNFHRIPCTAYVALPIDYMKAASGVVSPFMATWFESFIPQYHFTKGNFFKVKGDDRDHSAVTAQIWMNDVNPALYSSLALHYSFDKKFLHKFYVIGGYEKDHHGTKKWPPRDRHQYKAVTDLNDRFIFDFLLGNTDRGMNDHNNFVYGGCDHPNAECMRKPHGKRTRGPPRYAFLDHGSSFYTHKEPENSPFFGNNSVICRYRQKTFKFLKEFTVANKWQHDGSSHPLVHEAKKRLPERIFNVAHYGTFAYVQSRLEKIVKIIEDCIEEHGEDDVFSLIEEDDWLNPSSLAAATTTRPPSMKKANSSPPNTADDEEEEAGTETKKSRHHHHQSHHKKSAQEQEDKNTLQKSSHHHRRHHHQNKRMENEEDN